MKNKVLGFNYGIYIDFIQDRNMCISLGFV